MFVELSEDLFKYKYLNLPIWLGFKSSLGVCLRLTILNNLSLCLPIWFRPPNTHDFQIPSAIPHLIHLTQLSNPSPSPSDHSAWQTPIPNTSLNADLPYPTMHYPTCLLTPAPTQKSIKHQLATFHLATVIPDCWIYQIQLLPLKKLLQCWQVTLSQLSYPYLQSLLDNLASAFLTNICSDSST